MSFEDPATPDRPVLDSGVHVRDTERAPATAWQTGMAAVLVVAILCVFFYGLTSQRQQVAGSTPSSAVATNTPAPARPKPNVGTTGAASKADNTPDTTRRRQPPAAPQKNQ